MDAGDWTPEEWEALTREDAPPERAYQPWGRPLKETHPEQLQDADYLVRRLLDFGLMSAGPPGQALNAVVPRPAPGSEAIQRLDQGLDYARWLGPLIGLFKTRTVPIFHKGKWTTPQTTAEELQDLRDVNPFKKVTPVPAAERTWALRPAPTVGAGVRPADVAADRTRYEQDKAQEMRLMLEEMVKQMQARGGQR